MATVPVFFFYFAQISKLRGDITPRNVYNLVCLKVFMQIKKKNQIVYVRFENNIYVRDVWNTLITWDPLLN